MRLSCVLFHIECNISLTPIQWCDWSSICGRVAIIYAIEIYCGIGLYWDTVAKQYITQHTRQVIITIMHYTNYILHQSPLNMHTLDF